MNDNTSPRLWRRMTVMERFFSSIASFDDCWLWRTPKDNGYGEFMENRQRIRAHIWSYVTFRGEYDRSLDLDHVCHNRDKSCKGGKGCLHRRCVNPLHLEPASRSVNTKRGRTGDAAAVRTHCGNGHEFTPENTIVRKGGSRDCRACKRRRETLRTRQARLERGVKPRKKRVDY
ncbi:hypothetical protein [Nocardia sp. Marseille-Q1738]